MRSENENVGLLGLAAKRAMDIFLAGFGLVVAFVILLFIGLSVWLFSGGPIFFRQTRVGWRGRDFTLFKFRTMAIQSGTEKGSFEAGRQHRITPIGRVLRRTKLDELPQLWNVLRGDMSLVGPRPEVRKWVEVYPERWAKVLEVRPGITDPASIQFRHEEEFLARSVNPEQTYRDVVLPQKLDLYEAYVRQQSFFGDLAILGKTAWVVLFPPRR